MDYRTILIIITTSLTWPARSLADTWPAICQTSSSPKSFLHQLIHECQPAVRAQLNINTPIKVSELTKAISDPLVHKKVVIPSNLLNYGSGASKDVWIFHEQSYNQVFKRLFLELATNEDVWGFPIGLNKNDLFHGHVFSFGEDNSLDLGVLFHSKEYPNDPEMVYQNGGKGSQSLFSTKDEEFIHRNYIWLASTGIIYNLDGRHPNIDPYYFVPFGWNNLEIDSDLKDYFELFRQAKTFRLEHLSPMVKALGDINFFIVDQQEFLFFTYQPN